MKYEDALREWGARKIEERHYRSKHPVNRDTVKVEMEFNEGYACCGGTDPDCYCSLAESPTANVKIVGVDTQGRRMYTEIDQWSFDFATVLKEIVEAGGGTVVS